MLFDNKTNRGSRPNIDVVVMLRSLFIQQLCSLVMSSLKGNLADGIAFRMFLGTTDVEYGMNCRDGTSSKAAMFLENKYDSGESDFKLIPCHSKKFHAKMSWQLLAAHKNNAGEQKKALKQLTRLEDLHVWEMERVKESKKGSMKCTTG